ncbi:MAG: metallophosphoesterase [Ruminococcaceae bacterium]|nr:metallophosphoesterase [Oscillospiraceae bacterium]
MVQSRQSENTFTMLLGSDVHLSLTHACTKQMLDSTTHAGQAMRIVKEMSDIDCSAILGDYIWDNSETADSALRAFKKVHQLLGEHDFWAEGNHDDLHNGEGITSQEKFEHIGAWNTGAVTDSANPTGGYCYRDYADKKIRVICLNTCEETTDGLLLGDKQLKWLEETVSQMNTGWKCILLSHHPLNWSGNSTPVVKLLERYKDNILCNIHGHTHCYKVGTIGDTGIKRITVPNISFYRNNEYGENGGPEIAGIENGEEITWNKTAGSRNDTAFCAVTLDIENMVVYADRYGAGYDRVIDLKT